MLSVNSTGEKRMTGQTPFSSAKAMSPICRSAVSGTKFWTKLRMACPVKGMRMGVNSMTA
ncbi:hypothetical protein D3C87_1867100 [compost metagenome]